MPNSARCFLSAFLILAFAIGCSLPIADPTAVHQAVAATLTASVSETDAEPETSGSSAVESAAPTSTIEPRATVADSRHAFDQYLAETGGSLRDFLVRTDTQLKQASRYDSPHEIMSVCSMHFESTSSVDHLFSVEPPRELQSLHQFYLQMIRDWRAVIRTRDAFCASPSEDTITEFAVAANRYNQDLLDLSALRQKLLQSVPTN